MSGRVTANNPLGYLGVSSTTPANFKPYTRAPKTSDIHGYKIGDWWFYAKTLYQLMSKEEGSAFWAVIYSQGLSGQILIGSDTLGVKENPVQSYLTSTGGSIAFTFGKGTINAETTAVGSSWETITTTSHAMEMSKGYIPNNVGLVTLTLPTTAVVGSEIKLMGLGAGGFKIAQNASQTITHLDKASTVGVTGYVASTDKYDCFTLRCAETDTHFRMTGVEGNITVF